jgi:hypothetical protein
MCGKDVCFATPADAKRDLANKAAMGQWITEAKNLICFYRKIDPPGKPAFCKVIRPKKGKKKK